MKFKKGIIVGVILIAVLFCTSVMNLSASPVIKDYPSSDRTAIIGGNPYVRTDSGRVGQKITVESNFTGVKIPSWYIGKVDIIFTLYKWDTDPANSKKQGPVFAEKFSFDSPGKWIDPGDNDINIDFERVFAPGEYYLEYLMELGDPLYVPTIPRQEGAVAYLNNNELENVTFAMAVITDSEAVLNESPNIKCELPDLTIISTLFSSGASSDGESYRYLAAYLGCGVHFTVTDSKLVGFVINSMQSSSPLVELNVVLYRWQGDYESTLESVPAYKGTYEMEDSGNLENIMLTFEDYAFAPGQYLLYMETMDGLMLWTHAAKEGVTVYFDGEKYEYGTIKISYVSNPDAQVKEPSEEEILRTPVPTATPSPTATPAPTAVPTATKAPVASDDNSNPSGKMTFTLSLVAAIITVVIVTVVIIIVIKKKAVGK